MPDDGAAVWEGVMVAQQQRQDGARRLPLFHGVETSIRNNASAYPFSVMITAAFAVTNRVVSDLSVGRILLFVLGATTAFAVLEAVVTHGFKHRVPAESADTVVLGSALAMASVTAAVSSVWLAGHLVQGAPGWALAPFVGTTVYLLVSSIEMAVARRREEREGNAGAGQDE